MSGRNVRRKIRKRKSKAENYKLKTAIIVGAVLMAVLLGFLTARFVIGPLIGYNADESPVQLKQQEDKDDTKDTEIKADNNADKKSKTDDAKTAAADKDAADDAKNDGVKATDATDSEMPQEGYALQFGAFSTEDAAEKLAEALRLKGIETKIVETGGAFKVISPVLEDRASALKAFDDSKNKEVEDVFITSFS